MVCGSAVPALAQASVTSEPSPGPSAALAAHSPASGRRGRLGGVRRGTLGTDPVERNALGAGASSIAPDGPHDRVGAPYRVELTTTGAVW